MSEITLRYGVPLPASLTLIGKALAQVQLSVVHLDPALDPFEIAGKFLMRSILKSVRSKLDPKTLLYESQKLKVRAIRVIETFERLIGARAVNFHATSLEDVVRQTGRRLALGLTAASSTLAAGLTAVSTTPRRLGSCDIRCRRRCAYLWADHRRVAPTLIAV
jgi:ubiquinone biosynthesis protein